MTHNDIAVKDKKKGSSTSHWSHILEVLKQQIKKTGGAGYFVTGGITVDHRDIIYDVSFVFHKCQTAICSSNRPDRQGLTVLNKCQCPQGEAVPISGDRSENGDWHYTAGWKTHSGSAGCRLVLNVDRLRLPVLLTGQLQYGKKRENQTMTFQDKVNG